MVEIYKRDVYKTEKIIKAISTLYYDNIEKNFKEAEARYKYLQSLNELYNK